MFTRVAIVLVGLGIGALLLPQDEGQMVESAPLVPPIETSATSDFSHGHSAEFHPHGDKVCASGCAASNHPTEELLPVQFEQLLARLNESELDENNLALETILYFGRQSLELLDSASAATKTVLVDPKNTCADSLDEGTRSFLRRELSRTHALVSIRVVDEAGEIRASLDSTRVPLDRRHVFDMKENGVQPLVTSGTVKRVGLDHLWTRL